MSAKAQSQVGGDDELTIYQGGTFVMGSVIKFPGNRNSNKYRNVTNNQVESVAEKAPADSSILSPTEDEAFMDLIREWPCFQDLEGELTLPQLFELYYNDELTLAQDCALEFMFHMHDPDSTFDIGNALYTWDEEDRNFFIMSINMHADLIDKIKKEEL